MKFIGCLTVLLLAFLFPLHPVSAGCSDEERESLQHDGYSSEEIQDFCEERERDEKGFFPQTRPKNGGPFNPNRSRATTCQCADGRSCELDPLESFSRGSVCLCPPGPSGSCQGIATR